MHTGGGSKLGFFTLGRRCWTQKGRGDLWEGIRKDEGRSDSQHHNFKGGWELKSGASSCALYLPGPGSRLPQAGRGVGRGLHSVRGRGLKMWPCFYSKGQNDRPHKGNVCPCEKMLCSKLCFSENMQKKNTSLTTIPVFRGKTQTKYTITQDQPSWKFQFFWGNLVVSFQILELKS